MACTRMDRPVKLSLPARCQGLGPTWSPAASPLLGVEGSLSLPVNRGTLEHDVPLGQCLSRVYGNVLHPKDT